MKSSQAVIIHDIALYKRKQYETMTVRCSQGLILIVHNSINCPLFLQNKAVSAIDDSLLSYQCVERESQDKGKYGRKTIEALCIEAHAMDVNKMCLD